MANPKMNFNFDANAILQDVVKQFQVAGANPDQPGQWPLLPQLGVFLMALIAVLALGWTLVLSGVNTELEATRAEEPKLKDEYRTKLTQAVNLPELEKQKIQVGEYVAQLEKQLPGKAEMDALLSDINQSGLGRGLQFELFKPGAPVVKDYYAEQPIDIKVTGSYHDIGAFASDVAGLSRIVTLHNLKVGVGSKDGAGGSLSMEALAKTYRYLDPSEIKKEVKPDAATGGAK